MTATVRRRALGNKVIVGLITAFNLVSPMFVGLRAIYQPNTMPAGVETVVAWALAFAGMTGPLFTIGAIVLLTVALAQCSLAPSAKAFVIGVTLLSIICTIAMHTISL